MLQERDHYLDGGVVAVQDGRVKVALDADVVACRKRASRKRAIP